MRVKRADSLRIAVSGLAATYPFGGTFWDYLQYPLGLAELGHEVLYIEDTGRWCYDPAAGTFVEGGARNAAALERALAEHGGDLAGRWFFRDATGETYGRSWEEVVRFCAGADLFLNVSAACWLRDTYRRSARLAFIDTDPMYTQADVPGYLEGTLGESARARVERLLEHDVFFTFAENMGAPDCRVPTELFDWHPTRQPVVLSRFTSERVPLPQRRPVLTTVASWEPAETGPVVEGVKYHGKSVEFERFLALPPKSPLPLELALGGGAPAARLEKHGWRLADPLGVSRDPQSYRDYLARSFGEWSVAKNAYVASRSGWFSCRSALYLALGVPVVVQDTGFGCALPTGSGVLPFGTLEEAVEAIHALAAHPARHGEAAREVAETYFDSRKVLTKLVETAMTAHAGT